MEENKNTETTEVQEIAKKSKMPWANWSKKKKRWSLAGVIAAVVLLVLLFLPGIIVSYVVPPIASQILKVKLEIGSCFINIFDGSVRVRNVKIHNPEGYDSPYAFELGHFYVDVKMLSLASPKIEIADIIIEDMHATLEMKLSTNNLADISNGLKKPEDPSKEKEAEKAEEPEEKSDKEPKKMVIRHFKISDSDFTMLKVPWPIPPVELNDVGDGRSITEFAAVVYDTIFDAIMQASKAVSDGVVTAGKGIGKAAEKAGEAVVEGTSKALDEAGKSIKNIFKK